MMTQTHVLMGSALFSRRGAFLVSIAALIGGLAPDFPMYPFTLFHMIQAWGLEEGASKAYWSNVWDVLYWKDLVQIPMGIANSIPIYAVLIGIGVWFKKPWLWAFAGAGLAHCLTDLPLHVDDGHMHFFPFTDYRFASPVSYYNENHHAGYWRPIELALGLIFCAILAWRHQVWWNWVILASVAGFYAYTIFAF